MVCSFFRLTLKSPLEFSLGFLYNTCVSERRCDGMVDVTDSKASTSNNPSFWRPLDFSRLLGYTFYSNFPGSLHSSFPGGLRQICRCDGIGRRSGFKIRRWRHRVGSSPTTGTNPGSIDFAMFPGFFFGISMLSVSRSLIILLIYEPINNMLFSIFKSDFAK